MAHFKFSSIALFIMLYVNMSTAQDNQWYIKDGKYITSYGVCTYNLPLTFTRLNIENVRHPSSNIPSINYENDVFIIFDDGQYYNSRYEENTFDGIGNSSGIGYHIPNTVVGKPSLKSIKYLYFTNIYEGDDDEPSIKVVPDGNPGNYAQSNVELSTFNQRLTQLSTNHDIVKGKDITLIIPSKFIKDTLNCPLIDGNIKIEVSYDGILFYNQNDNSNLRPEILLPRTWANYDMSSNPITITVSSSSTGVQTQFINFKCRSPFPDGYFGTDEINSSTFTVKCAGSTTTHQITEPLGDSHDPNFVQVGCVYKYRKYSFQPYKYYVKYKIQFENEGTSAVNTSKLMFTLPSTIKSGSLVFTNWKHGPFSGFGLQSEVVYRQFINAAGSLHPTNYVELVFKEESLASISDLTINNRRGFIEFCAELKPFTPGRNIHNVNLYLEGPRTAFDETTYPIMKFIDPKRKNPNGIESNNTFRTTWDPNASCKCSLPPTNPLSGSQVHERR